MPLVSEFQRLLGDAQGASHGNSGLAGSTLKHSSCHSQGVKPVAQFTPTRDFILLVAGFSFCAGSALGRRPACHTQEYRTALRGTRPSGRTWWSQLLRLQHIRGRGPKI